MIKSELDRISMIPDEFAIFRKTVGVRNSTILESLKTMPLVKVTRYTTLTLLFCGIRLSLENVICELFFAIVKGTPPVLFEVHD